NHVGAEISEIRGSSGHGIPVLRFPEGGICARLTPSCPIEKKKFYRLCYSPKVNENTRPMNLMFTVDRLREIQGFRST
ncbi:hypothetical protein T265_15564, partial [Opisthorchis viverrini]